MAVMGKPGDVVAVVVSVGLIGSAGWRVVTAGSGPAAEASEVASIETSDAVLESAAKLIREGKTEQAATVLRAAVREHPDEQAFRVSLARALVLLDDSAEGYRQYEAALAIGPRPAELEFQAGTVASMAGLPERAIEHYSAARSAEPGHPDYPLYLGQVKLATGELDEARASLLAAALLDEERAVVWGTLAEIALRKNEATLAVQHAARARELEPRVTAWRLIEARALKRAGDAERALAVLDGVEPADAGSASVLRLASECLGLLGEPAEAARRYTEVASVRTGEGVAALALEASTWNERAGDVTAAIEMADRAVLLAAQADEAEVGERAAKRAERLRGG
ncbi:MAG: tetratricopeptide repeat protein [Planctomycetota bacterium]